MSLLSILLKVLVVLVTIEFIFCLQANIFINTTHTKYIVGKNKAATIRSFSFNLLANFESVVLKDFSENLVFYWTKNKTSHWIYLEYSSKSFYTVKRCNVEHNKALYREGKRRSSKLLITFSIDDILRQIFRCNLNENSGYYGKMYLLDFNRTEYFFGNLFLPNNSTAYFVISRHLSSLNYDDEFDTYQKNCQEYHKKHLILIISSSLFLISIFYILLLVHNYFNSFISLIVQYFQRNQVVPFIS